MIVSLLKKYQVMFPFVDNVYIISLNRQYYNDNEYWIQLMSQH